jgi:hypothetical protein
MTLVEAAAALPPGQARQRRRAQAFGLELDAPLALPLLAAPAGSGLRRARWELAETEQLEHDWPAGEGERLLHFRFEDGRSMLTVDRRPDLGYRIWAPGFGRHTVSLDGTVIRSALPRRGTHWQRLVFAQVLPLAAALQGLELFHASAVELGGRAVAFVAASGTGKTSVAAHLVAAGASFVTDDVLALETGPDGVVAHPGPVGASIDPQELRRVSEAGRSRLGRARRDGAKVRLPLQPVAGSLPLAAICFLTRSDTPGRLVVSEEPSPAPRRLLASSFLPYLQTPERLATHLDVCSRLAGSTRSVTVSVPAGVDARGVANELLEYLRQ